MCCGVKEDLLIAVLRVHSMKMKKEGGRGNGQRKKVLCESHV